MVDLDASFLFLGAKCEDCGNTMAQICCLQDQLRRDDNAIEERLTPKIFYFHPTMPFFSLPLQKTTF